MGGWMEAELKRKERDGFICIGLWGRIILLNMQENSVAAVSTPAWLPVVCSGACIKTSHRLRITSALSCHLKNGVGLLLKPHLIHQSDTCIYDQRIYYA